MTANKPAPHLPHRKADPMAVSAYFAADYTDARAKFLAAARASGAATEHHRHPSATGPDGEALFCDCAVAGDANAPNAIVILSGLHGVEGFCGSGCQTGLLSEGLQTPPDLKIVLIHAINPYGFAWLRRVNEDHVDLNRNFIDHDQDRPTDPEFDAIHEGVALKSIDHDAQRAADKVLAAFARAHGVPALQSAISRGQYSNPDAPYFGGTKPAWSNTLFRELLRKHCGTAKRVVLIDVHTGLGPYGDGELIIESGPDEPAYRLARAWWGTRAKSTQSGESVSPVLNGSIDHALPEELPQARTLAATLEFGTYSPAEVFHATRADQWLHHAGDPTGADAPRIKKAIRRAFYPDEDVWKKAVWTCFDKVLGAAIAGIAGDIKRAG